MKWKIVSDDPECKRALDKFAKATKEEYEKRLGGWRYRMIKKYLPQLIGTTVIDEGDHFIFFIPIKLPDMKKLRVFIGKITGRTPEPKWKEKMKANLEGYLKAENVKFDSIEFVEE